MLGPVGQLATQIARTQFVPKALQGQPASVAASILTGREMGLGPMTSLRGVQIIEGRPSLTSELLAARILAAGHRIEWKAVTDEKVTVRIERRDGLSEAEITWTMRDAQRAGLAGKGAWAKYPRALLRARALSECAQLACPDVALGLDVVAPVEAHQGPPTAAQAGTTTVQVSRPAVDNPPSIAELGAMVSVSREEVGENLHDTRGQHEVTPRAPRDAFDFNPAENSQEPEPRNAVTNASTPLVTRPQMRKLQALLTEQERQTGERLDREQRRHLIAAMAGIEDPTTLASANELTAEQASKAIDAMTDMARTTDTEPDTVAADE
jgi:hypothetical protein